MPTITHTPEPFSSTLLSLSADERAATGISEVLLFPPTRSPEGKISPAGFQCTAARTGELSPLSSFADISDFLPAQLQPLATQILSEYIRTGPVPAVPPLSKQAERTRSGSAAARLGRRLGKGQWSR